MATCGDSDYDMIEYKDLFDLRNAKLLRAEINTIDRTNFTADITLLDTCDSISSLDLTAIPFFYHCEFSRGTVSDLERGHEAFEDEDVVYVIFVKATWKNPEDRFFIVGHVDIRGTKFCGISEYLLIVMGDGYTNYATVFDTGTRAVLDLDSVVDLPDSPAKPSSLPCIYYPDLTQWFFHNFEQTEAITDVPISIRGENNKNGEVPSVLDYSSYTTTAGTLATNAHQRSETLYRAPTDPATFYNHEIDETSASNADLRLTAHATYYNVDSTREYVLHNGASQFWKIRNEVTLLYDYALITSHWDYHCTGWATADFLPYLQNSDWYSAAHTHYKLSIDLSFAGQGEEVKYEANGYATIQHGSSNSGRWTQSSRLYLMDYNLSAVGEFGFYMVAGYLFYENVADEPFALGGVRVYDMTGYGSLYIEPPIIQLLHTQGYVNEQLSTQFFSVATFFIEHPEIDTTQDVPFTTCVQKKNNATCAALSTCCAELGNMVLLNLGETPVKHGVRGLTVYKKKKPQV